MTVIITKASLPRPVWSWGDVLKTPLTPVLASSELLTSELKQEPYLSLAKNIHRGAANLSRRKNCSLAHS